MKRIGVILVWVVATLGTASLTYGAVSLAGRGTDDRPGVPVAGQEIADRMATSSTTAASSATTSGTASPSTSQPASSSTAAPAASTSSTDLASTSSTSTTAASGTTGATVTASFTAFRTTPGGTVGIRVTGTVIELISVQPAPGFTQRVRDDGPEKVAVEFEGAGVEYRVEAKVEDGDLEWKVEVED